MGYMLEPMMVGAIPAIEMGREMKVLPMVGGLIGGTAG